MLQQAAMTFKVLLSQEADSRKSLLGLLAQQGVVLGRPAPCYEQAALP